MKMLHLELAMLCVFKKLTEDPLIHAIRELLEGLVTPGVGLIESVQQYNTVLEMLIRLQPSLSLKAYIQRTIVYGEHLLSEQVEQRLPMHERMLEQAKWELKMLEHVADLTAKDVKEALCKKAQDKVEQMMLIEQLMEWENALAPEEHCLLGVQDWEDRLVNLLAYYKDYGCGRFAQYKLFAINDTGELEGIVPSCATQFSSIVGYDVQKKDLLDNTIRLGAGKSANNVLLYGARGTGKSSMVKALLTHPQIGKKVRLIEVRKDQLACMKTLFKQLGNKPYQFIFFIDDLAFEERTEDYTMIKTMLEGGVEEKPANILIYATSNRRHLVKEHAGEEERHMRESIEESMSLSDRFGLRIYFQTPTQVEYLAIVEGLAKEKGIVIDKETLVRRALQWEMWNNGKSGRTARQFIEQL